MAMVIKSLSAVTACPVCGEEMSTAMTCDVCHARMCCDCGKHHECKKEKEPSDGELHTFDSEGERGDCGGRR